MCAAACAGASAGPDPARGGECLSRGWRRDDPSGYLRVAQDRAWSRRRLPRRSLGPLHSTTSPASVESQRPWSSWRQRPTPVYHHKHAVLAGGGAFPCCTGPAGDTNLRTRRTPPEFGVRLPRGARARTRTTDDPRSCRRARALGCEPVAAGLLVPGGSAGVAHPARPAGRGQATVARPRPRTAHDATRRDTTATRLGRGDDDRDSPATQPPDLATHRGVAIHRRRRLHRRQASRPLAVGLR